MQALRPVTKLPLDVHLMIENPEQYVPIFVKAGADRITVHAEAVSDLSKAVRQVRGLGLMLGLELDRPGRPVVQEAIRRRLLMNCTQEKVLRIYPALNVTRKEIDHGLKILEAALQCGTF